MGMIYDEQIESVKSHYTDLLTICACGIILNAIMFAFLTKSKKVLASVYSIYMMQIVITDLIVCISWFIMIVMMLRDILLKKKIVEETKFESESGVSSIINDESDNENVNFNIYRIIYALFNMHSYINIFLLSAMSVERCIAVRKSLRCQKYKFRRNIICYTSGIIWLAAISCALPSLINPNLITQNEQTDLIRTMHNESTIHNKAFQARYDVLELCKKPLENAWENNYDFVYDVNNISVAGCFDILIYYSKKYETKNLTTLKRMQEDEKFLKKQLVINEYDLLEDQIGSTTEKKIDYQNETGNGTESDYDWSGIPLDAYFAVFAKNVATIQNHEKSSAINYCDPLLTEKAQIYQIVTNLALGFFIPFTIVIITNCYIAYHIGKQARRRLRRNKTRIDSANYCQAQKSKRKFFTTTRWKKFKNNKMKNNVSYAKAKNFTDTENENLVYSTLSKTTVPRELKQCPHTTSFEQSRLRTSSFKGFIYRNCRMSFSSAESLPTEQTSFTNNWGTGLSQSVPTFSNMDDMSSLKPVRMSEENSFLNQASHPFTPLKSTRSSDNRINQTSELDFKTNKNCERTAPSQQHYDDIRPQEEDEVKLLQTEKVKTLAKKRQSTKPDCCSNGCVPKPSYVEQKNAKRQERVSRVILVYVVVFAICWLPFKITQAFYYTEGLIDRTGSFCHYLWSWTRKLSFVSVLLNPAVFALTHKQIFPSIVHVLRKSCNNFCVRACIRKVLRLVEKQQRSESSDSNYGVEMQTLHRREKSKKSGEGRKRFRLMYRVGKKPKPSFISITRKNSKEIPNIETIDEEKSFSNGDH